MYCGKCGKEIPSSASICPQCGAGVPRQKNAAESEAVSMGNWFVTLLLVSIPLIGLIMLLVWAFGGSNPSKKNWARATLLWMLVGVVLAVAFGSAIIAAFASLAG